MTSKVLAIYFRTSDVYSHKESTDLSTDWVLCECLFNDLTEERKYFGAEFENKNGLFCDKYVVRLTNASGRVVRELAFSTKEEANRFFKTDVMSGRKDEWRKLT